MEGLRQIYDKMLIYKKSYKKVTTKVTTKRTTPH